MKSSNTNLTFSVLKMLKFTGTLMYKKPLKLELNHYESVSLFPLVLS